MKEPTVAQLRAFAAVAERLHFGAAAADLGISQPAVSTAVHALESALGVRLLERTTRQVLLTDAGAEVAARARAVLAGVDGLVEAARHGHAPHTGVLRLGVIPTVAPYLLPTLLPALRRRYPRLRPEVTEDQTARLLAQLAAGRLEVALLALPSGGEQVVELPVYREEFVLAVPPEHPLADAGEVATTALRDLELLLLEEGHCLRDQAIDVCRQAGAATDHPARSASLATVSQLVAAGLGATLLPASAVGVEGRKARLATVRFADPAPGRTIALVHRASSGRAGEHAHLAATLRHAVARSRLPVAPLE